ncbi:hypothetical protein QQF64_016894 [Cirrhinus molitorella]|uniref:Uncharacterized protein n=1 Tax=Cirrhinus molitorella TaxID=172907 RepID=A0ABR3LQS8_9TELE
MIDGPPKPASPPLSRVKMVCPSSLSFCRACCSISQMLCCHTHTYSLSLSLSLTFTAACGLVSVNPLTLGRCPGQIRPQRNHRTRPACQQSLLSASSSPSTSPFSFLLLRLGSPVHLRPLQPPFLLESFFILHSLFSSAGSAPSLYPSPSTAADLSTAEMTGLKA